MESTAILKETGASGIARCTSLAGLSAIHGAQVSVAVYGRDGSPFEDEAELLAGEKVEISATDKVDSLLRQLEYHPLLSKCPLLQNDVALLLRHFAELTGAEILKLLLTKVNTNMCRRFHTDMNDLRLLCTYTGPGTLLLPEDAADRKALQSGGDNDLIVRDPDAIVMAGETDVVILKGALYPKDGTRGAIHRSPTVEETGQRRLLLRIDTNAFLSF